MTRGGGGDARYDRTMWSALGIALTDLVALAITGAGAWHAMQQGKPWWPWVAGLAAAFIALTALVTLVDFTLAWWWRTPRKPAERIGPFASLRMVVQEFVSLAGAPWRMLFYRRLLRDPPPARSAHALLLVHGVLCNAGVWSTLARRIEAAGAGPAYAISYGPPLGSIDDFARQLAVRLDEVVSRTGATRVTLVAHSMGGLVVRACLARYGRGPVVRVLTIGSPHHGSRFASLCPGACLAQMRPGNAWLAALPGPPAGGVRFVSLYSPHDSMVAPQRSAVLEGADNVPFVGVGHNALLRDEGVAARVIEELRAELALAQAGRAAPATSGSPASAARRPSARV